MPVTDRDSTGCLDLRAADFRCSAADLRNAGVLALVAWAAAMASLSACGGASDFYQSRMAPAVMWASGRGFHNVSPENVPGLAEFLALETDTFSKEAIPRDVALIETTDWQRIHRYQYLAVASVWRLFGISWTALHPLYSLFYAVSAVTCYGLLRLGMNRLLASIGTFLLVVSPSHLAVLPGFRDYAKAPFLLAVLFILGLLVRRPFRRSSILLLAGAAGLAAGVGLGFRQDLFVCLPACAAVLFFFLPCGVREEWRTKLVALTLCFVSFAVAASPILVGMGEGSNTPQFFLLGLTDDFTTRLGVGGTLYSWGHFYDDAFMGSVIHAHAFTHLGATDLFGHRTAGFDCYSWALLTALARNFPADFAVRGLAAVRCIVDELPFSTYAEAPRGVSNAVVLKAYSWRALLLGPFWMHGRYFVALAVVLMSARSIRVAAGSLFLLLYFAGHTALQFSLRHYFYLEFIAWFAIGFLVQQALTTARNSLRKSTWPAIRESLYSPRKWLPPFGRAAAFAVTVWLCISLSLTGLRWYQQRTVEKLLDAYAEAETHPMPYRAVPLEDGQVRLEPEGISLQQVQNPTPGTRAVIPECWVVEMDAAKCIGMPVTFRCEAGLPHNNFTETIRIGEMTGDGALSPGESLRLYFPVYNTTRDFWASWRAFTGLELPAEYASCVRSVHRIAHPADLPLFLYVIQPPGWQTHRRFEVFTRY